MSIWTALIGLSGLQNEQTWEMKLGLEGVGRIWMELECGFGGFYTIISLTKCLKFSKQKEIERRH